MSNTQTTSRMDNQQDLLKDPEWWKKYKPGEWEDLEEDLGLIGMKRALARLRAEGKVPQKK